MKLSIQTILIGLAVALVAWLIYEKMYVDRVFDRAFSRTPADAMADAIARRDGRNLDYPNPSTEEMVTWEGNRNQILQNELRRRQ